MSQDTKLQAFEVECIESFEMRTLYRVKALNRAHAIRAIDAGLVPYDQSEPLEDSDEFKGVVRVESLKEEQPYLEEAPLRLLDGVEITAPEEADVKHSFL